MHEIESQNTTFFKAAKAWIALIPPYTTRALQAQALNLSVLYLELRLWYARWQINGMQGSIEDAKERMQAACQREANKAFDHAKRYTSISELGLSKVIASALSNANIRDLRDLDAIMYNLESIPNIGPSRANTIRGAYERGIIRAAIQAGRTPGMADITRQQVLFRNSVLSTMARLSGLREPLSRRADDYNAVMDDYCADKAYRIEMRASKQALWRDAKVFLEELNSCRRKASQGYMLTTEPQCVSGLVDSLAENEWREITFSFHVRFFTQVRVRNCAVVD